jgi:hypothetical protein
MRWWANCGEMARRLKVARTSGTDARGLMVRQRDTRSACCPISHGAALDTSVPTGPGTEPARKAEK